MLENDSFVVPDSISKLTNARFRPRLQPEHLEALRTSIVDVLECMPSANAQRHYIEALDMRLDEWLSSSADQDMIRPRVSLADLDVMITVISHKCSNVPGEFAIQIGRMIEVMRVGGW